MWQKERCHINEFATPIREIHLYATEIEYWCVTQGASGGAAASLAHAPVLWAFAFLPDVDKIKIHLCIKIVLVVDTLIYRRSHIEILVYFNNNQHYA